ncbi:hypothetical protein OIO90_002110 [Microbotryomycetes sp. JL221]|nr:hypothetical protein OIO90_002110 [Microbotryomycetes sp. JL221]
MAQLNYTSTHQQALPQGTIAHVKHNQQKHRKAPPFHMQHERAPHKKNSNPTETLIIADSEEDSLTIDDDETESDDDGQPDDVAVMDSGSNSRAGSTTDASIEDVCLACQGKCRCGGAQGDAVLQSGPAMLPRPTAAPGLKIRLSVSTTSTPQSSPPPLQPSASTTQVGAIQQQQQRQQQQSGAATWKRPSTAIQSPPVADRTRRTTASEFERLAKKPRTMHPNVSPSRDPSPAMSTASVKPTDSRQVSPARGTTSGTTTSTTPSRMSLRQVLAMSKREASASANNSDAETSDTTAQTKQTNKIVEAKHRLPKESLSDVSDLDLLNSDPDETEDDEAIEKAEERALRAEFENEACDTEEDDFDSDGLSDLEDSDDGDQTLQFARKEDSVSPTKDSDAASASRLPPTGGLGVVTWSDYDDEDDDDLNNADDGVILPQDIERELQELVALSEAVTGAAPDDDIDLEDFWLESVPEDESGSAADDESGSDDQDSPDEDEDEDNLNGPTMRVVDGGWNHQTRSLSGSSAGDSDSEEYDEFIVAEGDSTDSLDSDIDLIRFGIDVGSSDETESDNSEVGLYHDEPQTTSLADVQAPTVADLASMPRQMLFDAHGMPVSMNRQKQEFSVRPQARPAPTKKGGNKKNGAKRDAQGKFIKRNLLQESQVPAPAPVTAPAPVVQVQDVSGTEVASPASVVAASATNSPVADTVAPRVGEAKKKLNANKCTSKTPMMGMFDKKTTGRSDLNVVIIDDNNTFAPSPFSRMRRGKKAKDVSPSRRARADSKVSTTSNTDGSVSGEMLDIGSPVLGNVDLQFDLDDVLNEAVLGDDHRQASSSDDSDVEVADALQGYSVAGKSFMDFSRWNRIPIGAFRSSTLHGHTGSDPFASSSSRQHRNGRNDSNPLYLRNAKAVTSLNNTLSSPGMHNNNSTNAGRRAIERRMLTSPVFGPVTSPSVVQPPSASTASRSKSRGRGRNSNGKRDQRRHSVSETPVPRSMAHSPSSTSTIRQGNGLRYPPMSPFAGSGNLPLAL